MSGSIAHAATDPLTSQATVSGPAWLAAALTLACGLLRGVAFKVCEKRDLKA